METNHPCNEKNIERKIALKSRIAVRTNLLLKNDRTKNGGVGEKKGEERYSHKERQIKKFCHDNQFLHRNLGFSQLIVHVFNI